MFENNVSVLVESLVGLILGICLVVGRTGIAKVFSKAASNYEMKYRGSQEKILFIIIWTIGIVFILGSVFQFIKTISK